MNNACYVLTLSAEHDLAEIAEHSRATWGDATTNQYIADLHDAAIYIAHAHRSLAKRRELTGDSGLELYPIRQHYIVYHAIEGGCVVIVAIVHQTRDLPPLLTQNADRIRADIAQARQRHDSGSGQAPRQSLLDSLNPAERQTLDFIDDAADLGDDS